MFIQSSEKTPQNLSPYFVPNFLKNIFISSNVPSIDIEIVEREEVSTKLNGTVYCVEDVAIGEDPLTHPYMVPLNDEWLVKRYLGIVHEKHIFQVGIYPYALDQKTTDFQWIQKLTLRITGEDIQIISNDSVRSEMIQSLTSVPFHKTNMMSELPQTMELLSSTMHRLRIHINQEGLYVIPQLLIEEKGWDLTRIDPRKLRIVGREGEIPIRIIGESDGRFDFTDVIEFYGEPLWDKKSESEKNLDIYSTYNVYWLELGDDNGLRLGQEESWPPQTEFTTTVYPRSYPFTQHIETDSYFHRLPYAVDVEGSDYWFMGSPIQDGEKREYSFNLFSPDNYATQLVELRIKLRGQSRDLQIHPVDIYINDRRVVQGNWQGNQSILLECQDFSPIYLNDEKNILTVINRSEGEFSELILDWFEITYPKLYQAYDDYIRFCPPRYSEGKMCRFQIDGFSQPDIEIYKKDVSHFIGAEIETVVDSIGPTTYSVTFQDEVIDEKTEYIALAPIKKIIPDSLKLVGADALELPDHGADYVMITAVDSLGEESLQDLIDLREEQGLQVEVIQLETLYNIFNHGIPNPEAIRKFLRYACRNWIPAPQYVLFVGDGVYNNRSRLVDGNLIPVPLFQTTKYGASASDHWYTLLEGDDAVPDIAIGRIPIRKRTELEAVIEKIIQYEKESLGPWRNRYLLIGAGTKGGVFGSQSEYIIQHILDPSFHAERLYLSGNLSDPYVGGTEDLLRHFREGTALINFRGHGGGAIWSDAGLLDLDDIELIENKGKLPVVTSMTCFTGDFTGGRQSLGEALLCQEETGAIATWGATGLGWTWNDYYLLSEFCSILNSEPDLSLGEMLRRAKTAYLLTYGVGELPVSEVHQYTLLGDPALRLAFPTEKINFILSHQSLTSQDSVHISGTAGGQDDQLLIEFVGADRSTQENVYIQIQQNQWDVTLPIPENYHDKEGGIRSYIWDDQSGIQARGFVPFVIGKTFFDSLRTIPEFPSRQDSVRFSVYAQDPVGFHHVYCLIETPYQDSLIMVSENETGHYTTIRMAGPFSPGSIITYRFVAENANGIQYESETGIIKIPSLSDLIVQNLSLGGEEHVFLQSKIRNLGEEAVSLVRVLFECPQVSFSYEDTVTLERYGETIASVPFSPLMGNMDFIVTVNPDSSVSESNQGNNQYQGEMQINRFNVTPQLGSYFGDGQTDTVGLLKRITLFIPPGSVPKKTTVLFEEIDPLQDIQFPSGSDQDRAIHKLSLPNLENPSSLAHEAVVHFFVGHEDSVSEETKPYQWNDAIQRWINCPYEKSDSVITINSNTLGLFQLQKTDDLEPPYVEIQAENQPFSDGSYISKNAHISAVIQDKSGVDIRSGKILIYLDNELQTSTTVNFPDSSNNPVHVTVSFRPELKPGNHQIYVSASDVHGNVRQTDPISFTVSSKNEIQYLGNYPNPFKRETTFVYILIDEAIHATLKIYTVSGKMIRSFEGYDLALADYHEIVWDGKDDWGEEVANGVYFIHLKADYPDGMKEIKNTVAKIQSR
ncbi:hypothetical protein JW824_00955 [bacterium]|nr:hypothetical protein [bacterium]